MYLREEEETEMVEVVGAAAYGVRVVEVREISDPSGAESIT